MSYERIETPYISMFLNTDKGLSGSHFLPAYGNRYTTVSSDVPSSTSAIQSLDFDTTQHDPVSSNVQWSNEADPHRDSTLPDLCFRGLMIAPLMLHQSLAPLKAARLVLNKVAQKAAIREMITDSTFQISQ